MKLHEELAEITDQIKKLEVELDLAKAKFNKFRKQAEEIKLKLITLKAERKWKMK